jgi:hypothetical protein
LGSRNQEDHGLRPAWANKKDKMLSQKYPTQKRVGRVVKVVECLPSKCEALS